MVISYNQNLHLRIHSKKLQKQYYNSFHHILILQKVHTTIYAQDPLQNFVLLCVIINMNQNIAKFHVLLKKSQNNIKICGISKQNLWFSIPSTYNSYYSSQNFTSKNSPLIFQNFFLFNSPQSPHHDKNQQEFKIQTKKVP